MSALVVVAVALCAAPALASASPFRRADVERRGDAYVVSWRAAAREVAVYATRRPDARAAAESGAAGRRAAFA